MINVTSRLASIKPHAPSGITWVKLDGDDDYEWVLADHPDTPDGCVSIGGASNGSFRAIEKTAFYKMLEFR